MPRYLFHLEGPDYCLLDDEGAIVRGPEGARAACLRAVDKIAAGIPGPSNDEAKRWEVVVVDSHRTMQVRIGAGDVRRYEMAKAMDGLPRLATAH